MRIMELVQPVAVRLVNSGSCQSTKGGPFSCSQISLMCKQIGGLLWLQGLGSVTNLLCLFHGCGFKTCAPKSIGAVQLAAFIALITIVNV